MGDLSQPLATLITGLAGTAASAAGGAMTPGDQERHVYQAKEGGRLDEAQAQYTAEGMRNQLAAAIGREQPQERINYDVPRVAGPGIRSGSAQGFMPFQGRYQGLGGVSLNALGPRGYGTGGPLTVPTWDPKTNGNGNGNGNGETYDPLNEVPPWGVQGEEGTGEDSQTVGIVDDLGDEQQRNQDLANRENQDQINTLLKNINDGKGTVAGDPNPIDIHAGGTLFNPNTTSVENSILSGKGSQDLRAGGLANYADQVFGAHETWADTPSQMEDWSWKQNLTGYDPSGKFAWGKDVYPRNFLEENAAAAYAQQGLGGMGYGQNWKVPDLTSKGPQAKAPGKPAQVSGSENVWWQG